MTPTSGADTVTEYLTLAVSNRFDARGSIFTIIAISLVLSIPFLEISKKSQFHKVFILQGL